MYTYEKKFVEIENGETVAYIEKGQAGESIIILHGNMASGVSMLPLVDRVCHKLHCYAPDLRGYGDSSYNNEFRSLKELAHDVYLFCKAVGIEKAHVVGWSTATPVALELAVMHPELVQSIFGIEGVSHRGQHLFPRDDKGVMMEDKPYPNYEAMAADSKSYPSHNIFMAKDYDKIRMFWNKLLYVVNRPTDEEFDVLVMENAKERCQNNINWAWSVENMSDTPTAYAKGDNTIHLVTCPVTLTTGEKDFVVVREKIMENHRAIKHSKLLEYPNCGHVPLVDCPDRLAADVLQHVEDAIKA